MKGLLITIVIVSAVVAGVIYFSDLTNFDPAADASTFTEQVRPGQTWQELLDVRKPGKYARISADPAHMSGRTVAIKFNEDDFRNMMSSNPPAEGFVFAYTFSNEHAFDVIFDDAGKVVAVEDALAGGPF